MKSKLVVVVFTSLFLSVPLLAQDITVEPSTGMAGNGVILENGEITLNPETVKGAKKQNDFSAQHQNHNQRQDIEKRHKLKRAEKPTKKAKKIKHKAK